MTDVEIPAVDTPDVGAKHLARVDRDLLSAEQLARLSAYGTPETVAVGDEVYRAGDVVYDLVVVESGLVEIVRPATRDSAEAVIVRHGAGRFLGELNLLTGQTVYLTARVVEPGRIFRIAPERFRRVMAEEPDLSDILLTAFRDRRAALMETASRSIEVIGCDSTASSLALRTYLARLEVPHHWFDAESVAGLALMRLAGVDGTELPAVLLADNTLLRATPGALAERIGLTFRATAGEHVDLTVIGAGPAGLAAGVYGASEGLKTVVLDAVTPGGQAAASSRIENYLGFPNGLSGAELTGLASVQALKFGARIYSPCEVVELDPTAERLRVVLSDGTEFNTRAVVIATGARYRSLPLERWRDFEGAGIYYAATALEANACAGRPVTVLGGANSAGQAALFLAAHGCRVDVVVRGGDLGAGMSSYLVDRILADPAITVCTSCEVTALAGGRRLERVTITDRASGAAREQACSALFCFIGASPATDWLTGITVGADGFIHTDVQLKPEDLAECWGALGRTPLPFETSIPAVFAAGDVRSGSMKRVAAAVGEGASAVASVHAAIGIRV